MQATNAGSFQFRRQDEDDTAIFNLSGPPDLEGSAHLRHAFWECIHDSGARHLIIDLHQVPSLSPSLISLFISTQNVVAKHRGRMILAGINQKGMALLEETHLDSYFHIVEDMDAARKAKPE